MNKLLEEYKVKVEAELNKFFDEKLKTTSNLDKDANEMVTLLKDFTLRGGKRIRGALFYYGYRLFSDENLDEVIKASMCFELIQSSLLIHDDIIDQDIMRRNGDTMHISYEKYHKANNLSEDRFRFGSNMAILAGDLCVYFANELLADLKLKNNLKAIKELNRLIPWVIYGQLLDILAELRSTNFDAIMKINRLKTSTYTIEGPLRVGAILGGATEKDLDKLSKFAIPLGKAFQIQDDILGLYGDENKLGKPIGSDLKEGKRNILITKSIELASEENKQLLNSFIGKKDISEADINSARKIIHDCGALKFTEDLALYFVNDAKKGLKDIDGNNESLKFIEWLSDYIVKRKD